MTIREALQKQILYLDGGMGTLLQAQGLKPGERPERWNLSHPDVITAIHRAYYDAGSHIVNTNTFGAYAGEFEADELEAVIAAAVENAKQARQTSVGTQDKFVALDIGPSGRMLAPLGDLDFEDAVELFANTIRIGVKYGVDLIFIETMNDSYETKAALLAAKENSDLPVFVSNAYSADGKLMTGASPAAMVAMLEGMRADAIGVNCSLGPKALSPIVREYLQHASVPVLLKPNAGLPRSVDGKTVFDVLPDEFAADVTELLNEGVRLAGGCCGTTPDYIAALTKASAEVAPVPAVQKNLTCVSSYSHAVHFGNQPVLIGERINPTGKKLLKEALRKQDMDYLLKEAASQQEAGAHVLDVNVGLPEIDEKAMLEKAVCELQAVTDLPLQIDTANPKALEAAMRRYNGKAMINSVNGKQSSMDNVFPLVQKYGGLVVALTLDDGGIPATANERFAIAKRILAEATKYGIDKKDLIFDPLAMTISADKNAAMVALETVERIRRELGCHTSLGVSNVSFGLPGREMVNSTFFALALEKGLSAAILNPHSYEMKKAYHTFRALHGLDDNCADYIAFAQEAPQMMQTAAVSVASTQEEARSALQRAIAKGFREQAAQLTEELLKTMQPLEIVQKEIIPALNLVGEGFEKKTVYLPQLLMSAEAAKYAFEKIKASMPSDASAKRCSFVLATVKGDVHDIGKNIVRLLLENYGFDVIDLGRDVPPEIVAKAVKEKHAPIVGLSALMTTTVPAMEDTIRLLRKEAPWCRVIVGGAVLTREYANAIGADHYARDAMETVRISEEIEKTL